MKYRFRNGSKRRELVIHGVGIDIVEITRIKKLIDRYRHHFLQKVYTDREIEFCSGKAFPEIHFAGRWAAKEAFYKALPTALQRSSSWKSVEIVTGDASGRPEIHICSQVLVELFERESIQRIFLSISHERSVCTAVVLFE